jgi:hypothetical protein
MVIFPEAQLLGIITGFCFDPDDIDLTTVFTAAIAHRMTARLVPTIAPTRSEMPE